ncbi:UDP-N-acetyl-D-glucosamine dehydrogenase [Planctomycetales bacterium 10988]|nr:UDP-N-acetyl-D-glucosamine dehydrogenase [Planctomycetales bacterium 10988]
MNPIRIAVVGTGHLGKFHAKILSELTQGQGRTETPNIPAVELVGVVDAHQETAQRIAEQYNVPAYSSIQALEGKIDAAVLAVPTTYHYDLGCELLRQGVHLLVEKPLTATAEQADQLVSLAKEKGLTLGVGHVEQFNPAWEGLRTELESPQYFEASRFSGYTFRSTDIGVVFDLMIHDLQLILSQVNQPVAQVDAMGISLFGEHEDIANARLTFADGCVATVSASRASYETKRAMHIWTPKQFAKVDFAARETTIVRPHPSMISRAFSLDSLTPEQKQAAKEKLFEGLLAKEQIQAEPCDQLTEELVDFLQAIAEKRDPRTSGEDAAKAVEVAEWILESIESHRWDAGAKSLHGPMATWDTTPVVAETFRMPVPEPHFKRHAETQSVKQSTAQEESKE